MHSIWLDIYLYEGNVMMNYTLTCFVCYIIKVAAAVLSVW